ncbi:hypothetical protein JSQ81_05970 [Sporosarcina sp. Marseille-Q4063]|uniref:hypothetical protein n=1 Tax=Sporosarcina sp. Marseille-Q4063 TaxID=2810514 RepID=UPI001BB03708|nr:hypothetical protein [Sporosarcina sp. Marseille-Q4063]QUW23112.1 hypothetical protein JSQ81_05970 [Sporosarcina sp. Marseille-Q4063]
MKTEWQSLKQVRGCLLTGIYANQLHVRDDLVLFSSEYILKIKNPDTLKSWYWNVNWFEDGDSDDYLVIKEQETPEPLNYLNEPDLSPHQKHFIISSLFSFEDNLIKTASGYGFKNKNIEILSTLVFEFEESYLLIKTGPVIEARITKMKPNNLGAFIFSCD